MNTETMNTDPSPAFEPTITQADIDAMLNRPRPYHRARRASESTIQFVDGERLAHIPLSGTEGKQAVLDAEDYENLLAIGLSPKWQYAKSGWGIGYVKARLRGRHVVVARLLMNAAEDQVVSYRKGDATDLRRRNLVVTKRGVCHKRKADPEAQTERLVDALVKATTRSAVERIRAMQAAALALQDAAKAARQRVKV